MDLCHYWLVINPLNQFTNIVEMLVGGVILKTTSTVFHKRSAKEESQLQIASSR
jgi:hypothetical protein